MAHEVTLIEGDGVGPEVIRAAQRVVDASGVSIAWDKCEAGAKVFRKGLATGVPQATIDSLKRTRIALKGPLETPVGYGEKSANVTLRALFDTYANVRPVRHLPGIAGPFADRAIDFVVVRENVEDLYVGMEYGQTPSVAEALKLITRKGSEKIIRFAFELARAEGRHKVHCATKANILKLTEGLFKHVFENVSQDYPDIESTHLIIDNCAHQMVMRPEIFDVIVTTNLHGDIISDLASGLTGGLGIAPSANIGDSVAIFEAVHGSAPDIAGLNSANPIAILLSSVLMLRHLNEFEAAHLIEAAIFYTLGTQKAFPRDLDKISTLTTAAFTDYVIDNLGKASDFQQSRPYRSMHLPQTTTPEPEPNVSRKDVGVDIFIESTSPVETLGKHLEEMALPSPFTLKMISNRGIQVYPDLNGIQPDLADHWRARFFLQEECAPLNDFQVLQLVRVIGEHYRWMHIEKLAEFDHTPAYTKAQGES